MELYLLAHQEAVDSDGACGRRSDGRIIPEDSTVVQSIGPSVDVETVDSDVIRFDDEHDPRVL